MKEALSEYFARIANGRKTPLPEPEKGENGKYTLPASYKKFTIKKPKLTVKQKRNRRDRKEVQMFYEYIMESDVLRPQMIIFLLDLHAEAVQRMPDYRANSRIPYGPRKRKHLLDWYTNDYIDLRKSGKLVPETPFPACLPPAIADYCSIQARSMLCLLDEEYLMGGVRYKSHLKLIRRKTAKDRTERVRESYPDHVRLVDGYLLNGATNYDSKDPNLIARWRGGKRSWIPFPLWIDENATVEELKKDFNAILAYSEKRRIRDDKPAFPKGKRGNKSAGEGLPSPAKALHALRMWRIKKLMDRMHAPQYDCDMFYVPRKADEAGKITTTIVKNGAKLAEHCFAVLEGRSE